MREPTGSWIKPALELGERIAALPRGARGAAYVEESKRRGVGTQALRRQVSAARYVVSHAKSCGLEISGVVASMMAVEVLMRLDGRDRKHANGIRRDVLLGKISAHGMQRILTEAAAKSAQAPAVIADWGGIALGILDHAFDDTAASIDKGGSSEIGMMLRVDIEYTFAGSQTAAVFLSPRCKYSESYGKSLEDQVPFIISAMLFFDDVVFVASEDREVYFISSLFKDAKYLPKHEIRYLYMDTIFTESFMAGLSPV